MVRLVGGDGPHEGRVELLFDGRWSTVCDDKWDLEDAAVICSMLGYIGVDRSVPQAQFGPGTGPILLDGVMCEGGTLEMVRLVGGDGPHEGRVELLFDGTWSTVCDDKWDLEDAAVICSMLGYIGVDRSVPQAQFGPGTGPILLDGVMCEGGETNILDCRHNGLWVHNCSHHEDAGVACSRTRENVQMVRLVGGDGPHEGRVELHFDWRWSTVCDDSWDLEDARVVCSMLGYKGVDRSVSQAQFGPGTGPILLDGVMCKGGTLEMVRLVGGDGPHEGRLELLFDGRWSTVCEDNWDREDARVICSMLGFTGVGSAVSFAKFGGGTGPILLDDVKCGGGETNILECHHNGLWVHNCSHYEDAGVDTSGLIGRYHKPSSAKAQDQSYWTE
ncbi:neurotrypsin-like [Diadema setosum]|uniref:neurotrypsin-like n=1 Tax=Diadema setosum TaxID=31175 RepID=UPI003B3A34EA